MEVVVRQESLDDIEEVTEEEEKMRSWLRSMSKKRKRREWFRRRRRRRKKVKGGERSSPTPEKSLNVSQEWKAEKKNVKKSGEY